MSYRSLALILSCPVWFPASMAMSPIFLSLTISCYAVIIVIYLRFAQAHNPQRRSFYGWKLPHLPIHPYRIYQLSNRLFEQFRFYINPVLPIVIKYSYRKLIAKRGKNRLVFENIPFYKKNTLDVYVPTPRSGTKNPVLIFLYGGAWSTGDAKLYAPMALNLSQGQGWTVVLPNYTLFPASHIEDMVVDVAEAIKWTNENISDYHGDRDQIFLVGHSAGAHLVSLTLLHDAISKAAVDNPLGAFRSHIPLFQTQLPRIAGVCLLSGVYDIFTHLVFEASRGVEEVSAMARAAGHCKRKFLYSSPALVLQAYYTQDLVPVDDEIEEDSSLKDSLETLMSISSYPTFTSRHSLRYTEEHSMERKLQLSSYLPKSWWFVHGDKDMTVPVHSSTSFYNLLKDGQIEHVTMTVYEDADHSAPVLELMILDSNYSKRFLADLQMFRRRASRTVNRFIL